MSTYGDKSQNANSGSTLHMLWTNFQLQYNPQVKLHPEYQQYSNAIESYHEAGYDAFLTAKVLLKLAGRLVHETVLQEVARQNTRQNSVALGEDVEEHTSALMPISYMALGSEDNVAFMDDVERMPEFWDEGDEMAEFWKPYTNRLRLFGTEDGELRL